MRTFHGGYAEVAGQVVVAGPAGRAEVAREAARGAAIAEVMSTGDVPPSSAQRSSSRAASRRPANAASATVNDFASAPAAEVALDLLDR